MFCGNCGAQNPDGAAVCANCGAPLNGGAQPAAKGTNPIETFKNMEPDKRNKIIGIAAIALAVIVVVILLIVIFSGRSAESTAKKYVENTLDMDADGILDLIADERIEAYAEEEDLSKREARREMLEDLEDDFEEYEDFYKKISDVKVEVEVEDEYNSREIREAAESFEDYYDVEINIKDMQDLNVTVQFTYKRDDYEIDFPLTVYKVGGSWYITGYYAGNLYYSMIDEIDY